MKSTQAMQVKQNKDNNKIWYCFAAEENMVDISQNKNLFQNCILQVLNGQS